MHVILTNMEHNIGAAFLFVICVLLALLGIVLECRRQRIQDKHDALLQQSGKEPV